MTIEYPHISKDGVLHIKSYGAVYRANTYDLKRKLLIIDLVFFKDKISRENNKSYIGGEIYRITPSPQEFDDNFLDGCSYSNIYNFFMTLSKPFDFAANGIRSLTTAQRDGGKIIYVNNEIIYNEEEAQYEKYTLATTSWSLYTP